LRGRCAKKREDHVERVGRAKGLRKNGISLKTKEESFFAFRLGPKSGRKLKEERPVDCRDPRGEVGHQAARVRTTPKRANGRGPKGRKTSKKKGLGVYG